VILLGKALAGVTIGGLQALAVLAVAAAVPAIDLEWQHGAVAGVGLSIAAVLLLALLLNGFAQVVATRIHTMQGFHLVMNLLLFPLLFFSGAFFPLEDLPAWLKVLATANPLSYAVDLLRVAVYADGSGYFGLALDLPVLSALALAAILWGIGRRPALQP
jgi:ABC-2 type transport system permease protein